MFVGALFREFLLDEVSTGVDALGRDAARELLVSLVRMEMTTIMNDDLSSCEWWFMLL